MRPLNHRTLTATGLAVAAATASLAVTVPASAATSSVTGGNSTIALDKTFAKALAAHDMNLKPIGRATYKKDTLKLPISGGTLSSPTTFGVTYAGGFAIKEGTVKVTLTKLKADSTTSTVTALVDGRKRVKLFAVGAPQNGGPGTNSITFGGYSVTLTSAGVTSLDELLTTKFYSKHKDVGTGSTTVKYKTPA